MRQRSQTGGYSCTPTVSCPRRSHRTLTSREEAEDEWLDPIVRDQEQADSGSGGDINYQRKISRSVVYASACVATWTKPDSARVFSAVAFLPKVMNRQIDRSGMRCIYADKPGYWQKHYTTTIYAHTPRKNQCLFVKN